MSNSKFCTFSDKCSGPFFFVLTACLKFICPQNKNCDLAGLLQEYWEGKRTLHQDIMLIKPPTATISFYFKKGIHLIGYHENWFSVKAAVRNLMMIWCLLDKFILSRFDFASARNKKCWCQSPSSNSHVQVFKMAFSWQTKNQQER